MKFGDKVTLPSISKNLKDLILKENLMEPATYDDFYFLCGSIKNSNEIQLICGPHITIVIYDNIGTGKLANIGMNLIGTEMKNLNKLNSYLGFDVDVNIFNSLAIKNAYCADELQIMHFTTLKSNISDFKEEKQIIQSGGSCKICHEYNPWAEGDFFCYSCRTDTRNFYKLI